MLYLIFDYSNKVRIKNLQHLVTKLYFAALMHDENCDHNGCFKIIKNTYDGSRHNKSSARKNKSRGTLNTTRSSDIHTWGVSCDL